MEDGTKTNINLIYGDVYQLDNNHLGFEKENQNQENRNNNR